MENAQLKECFDKIVSVRYQHREGGRYAYVQLMAYIRELKEALVLAGIMDHLLFSELDHSSELLNSLVALRFEESHRLVFEDRQLFLEEVMQRFLKTENPVEEKVLLFHSPVEIQNTSVLK